MGNRQNRIPLNKEETVEIQIKLSDLKLLESILVKDFTEGYHFKLKLCVGNNQILGDIRNAVGDESSTKGLNKDWEPNEYGLELENLMDKLSKIFFTNLDEE